MTSLEKSCCAQAQRLLGWQARPAMAVDAIAQRHGPAIVLQSCSRRRDVRPPSNSARRAAQAAERLPLLPGPAGPTVRPPGPPPACPPTSGD